MSAVDQMLAAGWSKPWAAVVSGTATVIHTPRELYIGKYPPPPLLRGEEKISANVIWGKKYEKAERKRGKM